MAINVQFAKGTSIPTTSTLVKGGLYFNTSNKNIYFNNDGTLVTFAGTDTRTTSQNLTFSSSGNGAASGTTFNGGTARTISYNSIGAAPANHAHDDKYYTENEIDTKLTKKADTDHTHDSLTACEALGTMDVYISSDVNIYGGDCILNNSQLKFSNDTKYSSTDLYICNNSHNVSLTSKALTFSNTNATYAEDGIFFDSNNTKISTNISPVDIITDSVSTKTLKLMHPNNTNYVTELGAHDILNFKAKTRCGSLVMLPMIRWTSNGVSPYGLASPIARYGHIDYYEFAPNKFNINMSFQVTGTTPSDSSNYGWVDLMPLARHLNVVWNRIPSGGLFAATTTNNDSWYTYNSGSWLAVAGPIHGNANSYGMGTDCSVQLHKRTNYVTLCPGRKYTSNGRESGGWSLGYFDPDTVLQLNNIILEASDQFTTDRTIRIFDPGYMGYIILDVSNAINNYFEGSVNFTWLDLIDAWNNDTSAIQVSYSDDSLDIYSIEYIYTDDPIFMDDNFINGQSCVRIAFDTSVGLVEGEIIYQKPFENVQEQYYVRQDVPYQFYW